MTPTSSSVGAQVCYSISRVSVMAFYVATIMRAMHDEMWRQRLAPIACVGRLPLTNYLMQTLLATFIFYGWGLGFLGTVGPALNLMLSPAIFFAVQLPLSRVWLKYFELDPMEHLWRRLTYGRSKVDLRTVARSARG